MRGPLSGTRRIRRRPPYQRIMSDLSKVVCETLGGCAGIEAGIQQAPAHTPGHSSRRYDRIAMVSVAPPSSGRDAIILAQPIHRMGHATFALNHLTMPSPIS
jgi:hypothetical protein